MAWWGVAIQAADQYSPWALNAKAQNAFMESWGSTHERESKKLNAGNNMRNSEKNLARIQNDKQIANTDLQSEIAQQKADLQLQAALTGNTGTMLDVGNIAIQHQADRAQQEIDATVEQRTRQEKASLQAATYDFYILNQRPEYTGETLEWTGLTRK